ncbi:hypothetical protein ABTY20_27230 [Streptomyces sp. NPDC126497]|uniref:hypothetical protein n=1 Tax=Streptomyces sp. NPDC126497 TaxID=3155313 RepID=UPI00333024AB
MAAHGADGGGRVTITEIARRAGVAVLVVRASTAAPAERRRRTAGVAELRHRLS